MMRNRGRRDALPSHDFAAIHLFLGGDGLENHGPVLVG